MGIETTTFAEVLKGLKERPPGISNGITVFKLEDAKELQELADFPLSYGPGMHCYCVWRVQNEDQKTSLSWEELDV